MYLALCYRTLNNVVALRALVEKVTIDRQQAALKAREDLQALLDEIRRRQGEAGQLKGQDEIDFEALTDEERAKYNEWRLLTRFNTFDLDYVMGWG